MTSSSKKNKLWTAANFTLSGVVLALASFVPETGMSVVASVSALLLLTVFLDRSSRPVLHFFLFGFSFHLVAFYWLQKTISLFGGFSSFAASGLFLLYAASAALQFLFCAAIFKLLQRTVLARLALAFPVAWVTAELFFPRLFPWSYGNLFIAVKPLAAVAELGGVPLVSFLALWSIRSVSSLFLARDVVSSKSVFAPRKFISLSLSCSLLLVSLAWGVRRNQEINQLLLTSERITLGVVQGNLSIREKGKQAFFDVNLKRYRSLSAQSSVAKADILIWPESVVAEWTPEELQNLSGSRLDPLPSLDKPILYGGLSYRTNTDEAVGPEERFQRFNSAISLDSDATVLGHYHKRILMPFGEYIPFASSYPALKALSPNMAEFTPGDIEEPIRLAVKKGVDWVRAGVLICYEDLVPDLSREQALLGADFLVNLTNDAWYGKTAAPFQHHLLALWRSIEVRRAFVRSTNTGYTAVVSPLGQTLSSLPTFEAETLMLEVPLLSETTYYARLGDTPAKAISILLLVYGLFSARRRSGRGEQALEEEEAL